MKILIACMAAILLTTSAFADQLKYSFQEDIKKQQRAEVYGGLVSCMDTYLKALLFSGMRDRDKIVDKLVGQCYIDFPRSCGGDSCGTRAEAVKLANEIIELQFGPRKEVPLDESSSKTSTDEQHDNYKYNHELVREGLQRQLPRPSAPANSNHASDSDTVLSTTEGARGSSPKTIGPGFDCAKAMQPLALLICANAELSKTDLRFNQAYQALRQSLDTAGRQRLAAEDVEFLNSVKLACGVPESGAVAGSGECVAAHYNRKRSEWVSRLSGPALEEANRPLERHIALQVDLQRLGLLPATAKIDGIYSVATRSAIVAWQNASGRPATGFIGEADAVALASATPQQPAVVLPSALQPSAQDEWCKTAKLPSSIAICSDLELRAVALERQHAFDEARARLSPDRQKTLLADQNGWVKYYPVSCGLAADALPSLPLALPIKDCMAQAGRARIAYLRAYGALPETAIVPATPSASLTASPASTRASSAEAEVSTPPAAPALPSPAITPVEPAHPTSPSPAATSVAPSISREEMNEAAASVAQTLGDKPWIKGLWRALGVNPEQGPMPPLSPAEKRCQQTIERQTRECPTEDSQYTIPACGHDVTRRESDQCVADLRQEWLKSH